LAGVDWAPTGSAPPANRLERLKGKLAAFWSIRINDQYRIIFRFDGNVASDVRIVDYH
jgi:proteic killer suppression protein